MSVWANLTGGISEGLKVTLGYFRHGLTGERACITTRYDGSCEAEEEVERYLPPRFRGHLHNNADECITCELCARACPVDCFIIRGEKVAPEVLPISKKKRTKRPAVFDIDLAKCIYCSFCTRACPTDCLTMTHGFAAATEQFWGDEPGSAATARGDWTKRNSAGTLITVTGHGMLVRYGYGWMTEEEKAEEERKIKALEAAKKATPSTPPEPAAGA